MAANKKVTRAKGTLMRRTEPHQNHSRSRPPTSGPKAMPPIETLDQTAMATLRSSSSSNVNRMIASVAGSISAAPTASSARATISTHTFGEKAASREAIPNALMPIWNTSLCPNLSPSVPVPSSRPVMTRGYMLMIHSDSLTLADNSSVRRGTTT